MFFVVKENFGSRGYRDETFRKTTLVDRNMKNLLTFLVDCRGMNILAVRKKCFQQIVDN